ncbi:hypothetical protein KRMM14A1004_35070 [Krasilnikovia sp. MM14-A1004]
MAAVALAPPLLIATATGPAAAQVDGSALHPANHRLTADAPISATGSATRHAAPAAPAADSPLQLTQACTPATIAVKQSTTCTITAENTGPADTTVDLTTTTERHLHLTGATGATVTMPFTARAPRATLAGARPAGPISVAPDPGTIFGYIPLTAFGGNTILPVGDEQIVNLDVPAFLYDGVSYSRLGIASNGYLVVGGGDGADVAPQGAIPDPARPNNVLAPYWTDLDGTGATGVLANVLTDGVGNWIVIEWQVNLAGTSTVQTFQTWIGTNGVQDVQYAYNFGTLAAGSSPLVIGAENATGTAGARSGVGGLPTSDLRVTSAAGQPGGTVSYTVTAKGIVRGTGEVQTVGLTPDPVTVTTPVTVDR